MNKRIIIAPIFLLVVGAGWWMLNDGTETLDRRDDPEASTSTPGERLLDPGANPGTREASEITAARRRIADATLALEEAVAQKKAAEAEMQAAEKELEALEKWVADIEARGEDPVDYADEGLARLQPAFWAYEDALTRFELAEAMEVEASRELEAARSELPGTPDSDNPK